MALVGGMSMSRGDCQRPTEGEELAFNGLWSRLSKQLAQFVAQSLSSQISNPVVSDIVQEAFISLWQTWRKGGLHENVFSGDGDHDGSAYRWLRTAAYRLTIRESKKRRFVALELIEQADTRAHSPEEPLEQQEDAQHLNEALNRLAAQELEAITLHECQGLTHAKVAEVMQISVPQAKALCSRALEKLRGCLSVKVGTVEDEQTVLAKLLELSGARWQSYLDLLWPKQQAYMQHRKRGLNHTEAAGAMHIQAPAATGHKHKALRIGRDFLEKNVRPTPVTPGPVILGIVTREAACSHAAAS